MEKLCVQLVVPVTLLVLYSARINAILSREAI